jgi:phosphoribosylglycinamide formyltransferase-1
MTKVKVGVLISGSGSNLQALIDACAKAHFPAEIALVISNKPDVHGLLRAKNAGIPAHVISHKDHATREAFDDALGRLLELHLVEIVCLAGFMRLLTPEFVKRWDNKMLNIHPSLLPAFKGVHVHEQVLKAGVKFSGCTVHFVRPDVDSGPIVAQAVVPVLAGDTPEMLATRVLAEEHKIYPEALRLLASDEISIVDERVIIRG